VQQLKVTPSQRIGGYRRNETAHCGRAPTATVGALSHRKAALVSRHALG
jgi:hypothetical protein